MGALRFPAADTHGLGELVVVLPLAGQPVRLLPRPDTHFSRSWGDFRILLFGGRPGLRSDSARLRRRLPCARPVHYRAGMSGATGPGAMIGRAVPNLEFPSSMGGRFRFRGRVGVGPLALFFFICNATPG